VPQVQERVPELPLLQALLPPVLLQEQPSRVRHSSNRMTDRAL
jgi:hypothetical protein